MYTIHISVLKMGKTYFNALKFSEKAHYSVQTLFFYLSLPILRIKSMY